METPASWLSPTTPWSTWWPGHAGSACPARYRPSRTEAVALAGDEPDLHVALLEATGQRLPRSTARTDSAVATTMEGLTPTRRPDVDQSVLGDCDRRVPSRVHPASQTVHCRPGLSTTPGLACRSVQDRPVLCGCRVLVMSRSGVRFSSRALESWCTLEVASSAQALLRARAMPKRISRATRPWPWRARWTVSASRTGAQPPEAVGRVATHSPWGPPTAVVASARVTSG